MVFTEFLVSVAVMPSMHHASKLIKNRALFDVSLHNTTRLIVIKVIRTRCIRFEALSDADAIFIHPGTVAYFLIRIAFNA